MTLPYIDISMAKDDFERVLLELIADGMMTRQIMIALGVTRDSIECARRDLRQRGASISSMPVTAIQALRCRNIGNLLSRHLAKGKDARKLAAEQGRSEDWLNAMVCVYRASIKDTEKEMAIVPCK